MNGRVLMEAQMRGHRSGSATVDIMSTYRQYERLVVDAIKRDGLVLPLLEDRLLQLSLNCSASPDALIAAYLECSFHLNAHVYIDHLLPFLSNLVAAFDALWRTPPWSLPTVTVLSACRGLYYGSDLVVEITYIELPSHDSSIRHDSSTPVTR